MSDEFTPEENLNQQNDSMQTVEPDLFTEPVTETPQNVYSQPQDYSAPQESTYQQPNYSSQQSAYQQPDYSSQQNAYQQTDYSGQQNAYQQTDYSGQQNAYQQPNYSGQNAYQQPDYSGQNAYQQPNYSGQNAYQQSNYSGQNAYQQAYYGQAEKSDSIGFGIASLVLGILSIFLFMCCVNYILAILAIIFGIVQMVQSKKKGLAIGGIITAAISIIIATVFWVAAFAAGDSSSPSFDDPDSFEEYLQEYLEESLKENDSF